MAGEGDSTPGFDRVLVTAFQAGNEAAFDEIFKRNHHRVAAVCSRMLRSPQDVEEATQETFLKAYQALGRFNGNYYLGAWLARIATNVCVDLLRARSRSNLVALPEDQDDLATEEGPEDIVIGKHPRLERAIKDIQPLHASALALRAVEGLSHQEIAGRLRMTPTQVKALLHRARGSLRRAWDKAEGWAVAPLFGFRYLMNDRATADAGRIASVSPSAAPFLLERVAASAMLVAAALSGLPSSSPSGDLPSDPRAHGPVAVPSRLEETGVASSRGRDAVDSGDGVDTAAVVPAQEPAETDAVDELTLAIDKALKKQSDGEAPDHGSDESKGGLLGPGAAEGEKVLKKVRQTVEDVKGSVASQN